jgi:hypothetical protein
MSSYGHYRSERADDGGRDVGDDARAPGKRTLTQSLPPRVPSLRDQQREVVNFDAGVGTGIAGMSDTRSTIEAKLDHGPDLTDQQLARAQRKNPRWVRRLRVSAHILSTAPVDSALFAFDVAEKQATRGLVVDGIAGPKTVEAIAGEVTAARSAPARRRARSGSTMEPRPVVDMDDAIEEDFYDERATVDVAEGGTADRFATDDPFGMHLLDS